jgi:predicted dehydrogenase|tara:strand:+ start:149 stop:1294 length:1146 start_codon:yes stop_codon:yes gene_type:complete
MLKVGLIGCGHIAETYFRSQKYFNNIKIISCADINAEASRKCAQEYGIEAKEVDDLLADKEIDIVLNLTTPQAHYEIIKKTLLAGKHSYCEKPLSTNYDHGAELLQLADDNNLYIGNAPDTFLGGGAQLARQLIDQNEIGDVKLGVINFAFPGVQSFHPNPESWFKKGGGPVIDMGPYYFTTLVNLLGPAKSVQAKATKVHDHRTIATGPKKGDKFEVEIPTSIIGSIEFKSSTVMQVFLSFDVINHQRNHIELYGTKGSMIVPDPNMFGGSVFSSYAERGEWKEHSSSNMLIGKTNIFNKSSRSNEEPEVANYRGVGLSEMIDAIENKRVNRCNGKLSLHVLDIIDSTINAAINGVEQDLRTSCERPSVFSENEIKKLMK